MSRGSQWWARGGRGLTRRATVGTGAVALALVAVTAAVWTSPGGSADDALVAVGPTTEDLLRAEIAALELQLEQATAPDEVPSDDLPVAPPADVAPAPTPPSSPQERTRPARTGSGDGDGDGPANPRNPSLPPAPAPSAGPPASTPPTAPPRADLLDPERRYYGMYTVQSPFNWATLDDVAVKTGVLPDLAGYFSGWDKPFRADAVTRSWARGMLPLLTWESRPSDAPNNQRDAPEYALSRIIAGDHDAYLRQYARDIVATGLPLAIRLDHEMNGDWYPWSEETKTGTPINGNARGEYVQMWRHVHDIFEAEGANAFVIWVWAPNIVNNLPPTLQEPEDLPRLYPGDEYVDWVGLSGYYRPPFRPGQEPTFEYTFDTSLAQLRELTDKPILLAEVGASEVGGNKAAWVRSFFDGLTRPENADVIGFAWFSLTVTSQVRGETVTNDWRVDSSRGSVEEFRAGLTNPATRMGGTPYPPGRSTAPTPATPSSPPTTAPTATPAPVPSPASGPSPGLTPGPTPSPAPSPAPSPTPEPAPSPTPDPAPSPTQSPTPGPTQSPTADPALREPATTAPAPGGS